MACGSPSGRVIALDYAWFIYTVALIAIALAACFTSVTVWVLTNRKDCLVAAAGFLAYAFDVATILFDEYMREKPLMDEYFSTGLTHPVANIALRVAIITCIWLWVALRIHAPVSRVHVVSFAALAAAVFTTLAPIGRFAGSVRTMAFWGFSDLLIIGALIFAWWWRNNKAGETGRLSIDRIKRFWVVVLAISIAMLIEDVLNILVIDPDVTTGWARDFFWHLTERNLSENILMVACAARMVVYNRDVMQIFSKHPMEDTAKTEGTGAHRDFESRLLRFADDNGMSKREREVLGLAIEGKDTQGIANELFISTGTVKAHMHRIYSKAGVEHRQDLINAFWKY